MTAGPAEHEVHQVERELALELEAAQPRVPRLRWRRPVAFLIVVVIILVLWEGVKFLGGIPWRLPGEGPGDPIIWNPPFRWPFASDLNLPHVWNIAWAMGQPFQRGADVTLLQYLVGAALYTWREAFLGFVLGSLLGLLLATVFVHSRLAERAFVPYVIASQTIPIIALAPLIVFAIGQGVLAVVVIATYLTFFPVTIAMLRGLRSFDPRALELLRSYGASRREVFYEAPPPGVDAVLLHRAQDRRDRGSIVGAIIGEDTGAIQEGLGRVITTFNQYYATGPEKLWAAIFIAAVARRRVLPPRPARRDARAARPARHRRLTAQPRSPTPMTEAGRPARRPDQRRRQGVRRRDKRIDRRPVRGSTSTSRPGEFVSLIGPSGCGKSTLLRVIGDLVKPTRGTVQVNGKTAEQARQDRDYGMVFQAPGPVRLAERRGQRQAAARDPGQGQGMARGSGRGRCSSSSSSATSRGTCRTSCRAACSSGSRSRARSRSSPGSCSWTSRSARWTR